MPGGKSGGRSCSELGKVWPPPPECLHPQVWTVSPGLQNTWPSSLASVGGREGTVRAVFLIKSNVGNT